MRPDLSASSIIEYESLASVSDLDERFASGSSLYIRLRGSSAKLLGRVLALAARRLDPREIGAVSELGLLAEILRIAHADERRLDFDDAYEDEIWIAIGGGKPKQAPDAPLPYSIAGTNFETFVRALAAREDAIDALGSDVPVIPPVADFGYEGIEPLNALTFSTMGCDGVHYAVVAISGEIRDTSPVIQISPMDEDAYCVLASSLVDYLAVACAVPTKRIESLLASERAGQRVLASFLADHFDSLRLFDDEARLRSLERYLPYLVLPKP